MDISETIYFTPINLCVHQEIPQSTTCLFHRSTGICRVALNLGLFPTCVSPYASVGFPVRGHAGAINWKVLAVGVRRSFKNSDAVYSQVLAV